MGNISFSKFYITKIDLIIHLIEYIIPVTLLNLCFEGSFFFRDFNFLGFFFIYLKRENHWNDNIFQF